LNTAFSSNPNAQQVTMMRVQFLNPATKSSVQMAIPSNTKVSDLKNRVVSLVPNGEEFTLNYKGNVLENEKLLSQIGYEQNTNIEVDTTTTVNVTNPNPFSGNQSGVSVTVGAGAPVGNGQQQPAKDTSPPKQVNIQVKEESGM
jgi:LEA14-like dessication related protein